MVCRLFIIQALKQFERFFVLLIPVILKSQFFSFLLLLFLLHLRSDDLGKYLAIAGLPCIDH